MRDPQGHPPKRSWLRSIGVKLTVSAALMMLLFAWLRPEITRLGYRIFRLERPTMERPLRQMIEVFRSPELWAARCPAAQTVEEFLTFRLGEDELVALIDCSGKVIAHSLRNTGFDASAIGRSSVFRLTRPSSTDGIASARYVPIWDGEELLGYEVALRCYFDGRADSPAYAARPILRLPPDSRLDRKTPARASVERFDLIREGVTMAIAVITALLLGLLVTFLVTRRLRSLATRIESSKADEFGLPELDVDRGHDEISLLSRALSSLRSRIRELLESLHQRDTARREWIAQVSHDIRTPLASMSLCLDRARGGIRGDEGRSVDQHLKLAWHDLQRVRKLVNDLFELARLEITDELTLEGIPPLELIGDAVRSVRPQAGERGIHIEIACAEEVAEVQADGHRLMRACENLLSNAIRHAESCVTIHTRASSQSLFISVEDDGPGFDGDLGPVDLDSLRARRRRSDSIPLGLMIAQRVAEAHGGELAAENLPAGARLELRIPRQRTNP